MIPEELLKNSTVEYWKVLAKLTNDPELKKRIEELIANTEKLEETK